MDGNPRIRRLHILAAFLASFCFLTLSVGIAAWSLIALVRWIYRDNPYRAVVHVFYGFGSYNLRQIDADPFAYLLAIVLVSSLVGAVWTVLFAPKTRRQLIAQVLIVPWISLVIASPIWGLIWSVKLWSPQYFVDHFPTYAASQMWLYYRTDASTGLFLGWLSAILSFPINVLSYAALCLALLGSKRLFSAWLSRNMKNAGT